MSVSSYDPEHCGILTVHVIIMESLFVASFSRLSNVVRVFWKNDHVSHAKKNIEQTLAIAEEIRVYNRERVILYGYAGKIANMNCSEKYKELYMLANRTSGYLLLPLNSQHECLKTLREDEDPFSKAFVGIDNFARENMCHTFFYRMRCDDFHFKLVEWNWLHSIENMLDISGCLVVDVFPDSVVVKTSDYMHEVLGVYEDTPETFTERFEPIENIVVQGFQKVVVFYSGIDGEEHGEYAHEVSCMLKRMFPDKQISFHILPLHVIVDCMVMSTSIHEQNIFSASHSTYEFFDNIYLNCMMNNVLQDKKTLDVYKE